MAPLTRQFSASVVCRCQVVNTRSVTPRPATARSTEPASRTSACTCSTPGTSYRAERDRPTTRNPLSCSARALLYPAMPVTPTTSAVRSMRGWCPSLDTRVKSRLTSGPAPTRCARTRGGTVAGRVDGVRVVITGGGSGLGRGFATGLAAEGAVVGVLDREPEAAQAVVEEVRAAGSTAVALVADV